MSSAKDEAAREADASVGGAVLAAEAFRWRSLKYTSLQGTMTPTRLCRGAPTLVDVVAKATPRLEGDAVRRTSESHRWTNASHRCCIRGGGEAGELLGSPSRHAMSSSVLIACVPGFVLRVFSVSAVGLSPVLAMCRPPSACVARCTAPEHVPVGAPAAPAAAAKGVRPGRWGSESSTEKDSGGDNASAEDEYDTRRADSGLSVPLIVVCGLPPWQRQCRRAVGAMRRTHRCHAPPRGVAIPRIIVCACTGLCRYGRVFVWVCM